MTTGNVLATWIRRWSEQIAALPPAPSGIRAHHGVPYGRVFRQWDTNGRLWLWANAGMIADLPRPQANKSVNIDGMLSPTFGIPIYSEASHEAERVGVWLCCVVYVYADGSNSTGRSDDQDGGCPNCGGHGQYRSRDVLTDRDD